MNDPKKLLGIIIAILVLLPILFFIAPYLFVVLLIAGMVLLKKKSPEIKGAVGEWRVNKVLEGLGPEYTVFHDLYVPVDHGYTTQVDHVIASPYGLFVIETKHYRGWIFGSEKQKYWTQTIYQRKHKLYNPIWQNYGHIKALENYLEVEEDIFHSIIAFSESSTFKFKKPFTSAKVIQFPEIIRAIKGGEQKYFSHLELEKVKRDLKRLEIKDAKVKKNVHKKHVEVVKQSQKNKIAKEMKSTQRGVCPKCGGELSKKKGKYGMFYGCIEYPKCRYTKQVS